MVVREEKLVLLGAGGVADFLAGAGAVEVLLLVEFQGELGYDLLGLDLAKVDALEYTFVKIPAQLFNRYQSAHHSVS